MKFSTFAFVSLAFAGFAAAKQCAKNQFEHNAPRAGDCCLPVGGNPFAPQCPGDKECPSNWEWHSGFECCVPKVPNHPTTPTCPSGPWDHDNQCCHKPSPPSPPPSKPSGGTGHHWKRSGSSTLASRNWRSKTVSCTNGQSVCNVSDGLSKSNTWACVDTQKDVNFCGGCGTPVDQGEDCSAIPNSWNVGCSAGKCMVFTCEPGFYVGRDGTSCHAI